VFPDYVGLPNVHDQWAIAKLRADPIGDLAADRLLTRNRGLIPEFREALVQVYLRAAQTREMRKATKRQIAHAKSAARHATKAIKHLEAVSTDGRNGLSRLLEGPPLDDAKGERERNSFGSTSDGIRLKVAQAALELQFAIDDETKKLGKGGERSKRLRTLVESLANWWSSGGKKSIAPYVKANRRDDGPAIVHGRSGKFLELAVALFCDVDVFTPSEVEAAVTNVYEAELSANNRTAAY
jgi:hypothetical protein